MRSFHTGHIQTLSHKKFKNEMLIELIKYSFSYLKTNMDKKLNSGKSKTQKNFGFKLVKPLEIFQFKVIK